MWSWFWPGFSVVLEGVATGSDDEKLPKTLMMATIVLAKVFNILCGLCPKTTELLP
jgi:hypothetical protein